MNGIYIHVPFCVKKCLYCDFYSETDMTARDEYVRALTKEIALTARTRQAVDTVYLGGGTPSVLSLQHLETIFAALHDHYDVMEHSEITLEINPGTLDTDDLAGMKQLGINRLSLGIQSFQDEHLQFLGRIHIRTQSENLIRSAQTAGFDNLGFDLIYGIPGQDTDTWREDLETALSFNPAHLSCYMLTWEPGTPLFQKMEQGLTTPMHEDDCERLFFETMNVFEKHGFDHYEVSNFARTPALRSRHNSKYWHVDAYTGLGPSAHSYVPETNKRYWNVRNLNDYVRSLDQGLLPVSSEETLSLDEQMTEALFLGLRLKEGISIPEFNRRFSCDFLDMYREIVESLIKEGFIDQGPDRIRLTKKGMVLADRITSLFVNYTD